MSAYDTAVLADSPIDYWVCDGTTTTDSGSGGRAITYTASPTTTTLPNGDTAMVLNGTTQYASAADNNAYTITTTGTLTVECWLRADIGTMPTAPNGWADFLGKGTGSNYEWNLRYYNSPTLQVSSLVFNLAGATQTESTYTSTLTVGSWYHYVVVFAKAAGTGSAGSITTYLNGALLGTVSIPAATSLGNGTAALQIGRRADAGSYWKGAIGKVALYSSSLSATQVAAHYSAMSSGSALSQAPADTVGTADSATGALSLSQAPADTVGATDAVATSLSLGQAPADTVGTADAVATSLSLSRSLADTVPSSDTAATPTRPTTYSVAGYVAPITSTAQADGFSSATSNTPPLNELSPWWYSVSATATVVLNSSGTTEDPATVATLRGDGDAIYGSVSNDLNGTWTNNQETIYASPSLTSTLVTNLVNLAVAKNFDGVDVDFEDTDASYRTAQSGFASSLATALHAQGKKLSFTVHPKENDTGYDYQTRNGSQDYAAIGAAVDKFRVMTYDWNWQTAPNAGAIAPWAWVDSVMTYAASTVTPSKVILGCALWGYDWPVTGTSPGAATTGAATVLTYADVQALITAQGATPVWDATAKAHYFTYTVGTQKHEVWYEDAASISAKLDIVTARGLGGVFFWRLGGEDAGVWSTVATKLPNSAVASTLADTVSAADTATGALSLSRAPADTVGTADAVAAALSLGRSLADTVPSSDAAATAAVFSTALADALSASDAAASAVARSTVLADTVTAADAVSAGAVLTQALADTVSSADAAAPAAVFSTSLADTVSSSDAAVTAAVFASALADTLAAADAVSAGGVLTQSLADTVGAVDAVATAAAWARTAADAVSTADAVTTASAYAPSLADAVGATDALTGALSLARSLTDAVASSDAVSTVAAYAPVLTDTVTAVDAVSTTAVYARTVADTVQAADAAGSGSTGAASIPDTVGTADTVTVSVARAAVLADSLPTADAFGTAAAYSSALADALPVVDTASTAAVYSRAFADTLAVLDSPAAASLVAVTLADTVTVADHVAFATATGPPVPFELTVGTPHDPWTAGVPRDPWFAGSPTDPWSVGEPGAF